jgi:TRAP-type mannitol/chloroaromatic compound transport system permease large subunit
MFMWIILAALCFGAVFDGLGAVHAHPLLFLETWGLEPLAGPHHDAALLPPDGMFLDDTAMLVIVAPLYVPLVIALGFDPIWYGVLYTITCQIAYMTPPFGYNLFLMRAMAPPEVTLGRYLQINRALRSGDDHRPFNRHGLFPQDRAVVARTQYYG